MQKFKLFFAACAVLLSGMVMAATEPQVTVPANAEPAVAALKTAAAKASGLVLPPTAKLDKVASDELFGWYEDVDGAKYLVYIWEKPATVYSLNIAEKQKLLPGRESMTILPGGRSKGKLKITDAVKVVKLNPGLVNAATLEKGMVLGCFLPTEIVHDSQNNATVESGTLPGWGEGLRGLWQSTGIYDLIRQTTCDFSQTWILGLGRLLMMFVALVLIYLAIVKEFEPLLLLPIGFGALLANIPLAGISGPDGIQGMIYNVGIESGVFPLLIFMGVGAMTDFGPLLANPKTALLGGAAQFGIFSALLGALLLTMVIPGIDFHFKEAASIGIIGGADGPTSIYLTSKLSPKLLGAVAVAAYSYMALVPIIQPPIMKALTSKKDRQIVMGQLRTVSKTEKIVFPIVVTVLVSLMLPSAAPLIGSLMLGNLFKESGVTERLSKTAQNELMNIVTIFLGVTVGATAKAETFLQPQTLKIIAMGVFAFGGGTAGGVLLGDLMCKLSGGKINPLIGSAGVSAVPMAARVSQKEGQKANPGNFLLMHAMGPNVAGVVGSAVAAGILLSFLG